MDKKIYHCRPIDWNRETHYYAKPRPETETKVSDPPASETKEETETTKNGIMKTV